jgi:hypothetical protein
MWIPSGVVSARADTQSCELNPVLPMQQVANIHIGFMIVDRLRGVK